MPIRGTCWTCLLSVAAFVGTGSTNEAPEIESRAVQLLYVSDAVGVMRAINSRTYPAGSDPGAELSFPRRPDDGALYYAPADADAKDPLARVNMYCFRGGSVIYMRGEREGILRAQRALAFFDRPRIQTRLGLWELDVRAKTDRQGLRKLSNLHAFVAKTLDTLNSQSRQMQQLLRDSILREEANTARTVDDEYIGRLPAFYSPAMLKALRLETDKSLASQFLVSTVLVKPDAVEELNEMLLILALAPEETRKRIWADFDGRARTVSELKGPTCFSHLRQYMESTAFTPVQWELTRQLADDAAPIVRMELELSLHKATVRAAKIVGAADQGIEVSFQDRQAQIADIAMVRALTAWLAPRFPSPERASVLLELKPEDYVNSSRKLHAALSGILASLGTAGNTTLLEVLLGIGDIELTADVEREKLHTAAANELLKRLHYLAEDDFRAEFVTPALTKLHRRIDASGLQSNTLTHYDFLSVNQPPNMMRHVPSPIVHMPPRELPAPGPGIVKLLQVARENTVAAAMSGLQELVNLPPAAPPLPSWTMDVSFVPHSGGKAARISFYYNTDTMTREPGGLKSSRPLRLDFQVDTQFDNLGVQELNQVEFTYQLGTPTRRHGGIPGLKRLKGLRSIPLIGWSSRENGKAGVTEQRTFWGEASIYRPLNEVLDSLRNPGTRRKPEAGAWHAPEMPEP